MLKAQRSLFRLSGGVFRHGRTVDLQQISKPDLIVEGSVAVNQQDIGLEKDVDTAAQKYGL